MNREGEEKRPKKKKKEQTALFSAFLLPRRFFFFFFLLGSSMSREKNQKFGREEKARIFEFRLLMKGEVFRALGLESEKRLEGKHFEVADTGGASGLLFVVFGLQMGEERVAVCMEESPQHYQIASAKMGARESKNVTWIDLSKGEGEVTAGRVRGALREVALEGRTLVLDSLFPLQCCERDVFAVVDLLRELRLRVGPKGMLFSRFHSDSFKEQTPWLLHESDFVCWVQEVSAQDVSGRVCVTERLEKEARPWVAFTVSQDGRVSFSHKISD